MRIAFVISLTAAAAAVNLNLESDQMLAQTGAECEAEMNFARVANLASPMGLAQAGAEK